MNQGPGARTEQFESCRRGNSILTTINIYIYVDFNKKIYISLYIFFSRKKKMSLWRRRKEVAKHTCRSASCNSSPLCAAMYKDICIYIFFSLASTREMKGAFRGNSGLSVPGDIFEPKGNDISTGGVILQGIERRHHRAENGIWLTIKMQGVGAARGRCSDRWAYIAPGTRGSSEGEKYFPPFSEISYLPCKCRPVIQRFPVRS